MKNLSNSALVARLRDLVSRERALVTEILQYLREVEERKLFLGFGYSSLFAFCMGELGYSEPEAQLRIQAMRLVRVAPEVADKIESGDLSMSVAAQIQSASRREDLPAEEVQELVRELSGSSKREAEKVLAARFPEAPRPERARPVSEDRVEVRFSISREVAEAAGELFDRGAHVNFERSYEKLFARLVEQELARLKKAEEKAPRARPEQTAQKPVDTAPPPQKPEESQASNAAQLRPDKVISRHIPNPIRRAVFKRQAEGCEYLALGTNHRCGSRHGLQVDHIIPFAEGGTHDPSNLRLLCGAHNRARNEAG
jgi:hypothetical protein